MFQRIKMYDAIAKVVKAGGRWIMTATDSILFQEWPMVFGYPTEALPTGKNIGDFDWIWDGPAAKAYFVNIGCYRIEDANEVPLKVCHGIKGEQFGTRDYIWGILDHTPVKKWPKMTMIKELRQIRQLYTDIPLEVTWLADLVKPIDKNKK
jgi:hypothetical protein